MKLLPDEKIIAVQRQHWLAVVMSLSFHMGLIVLLVCVALFFIYQSYPFIFFTALLSFSLLLLSFLATLGTFVFLDWYYNFYIITNKRIINEHFFRLSGTYYEEVFLEENIESADRVEKNLIYNLFGVEDVYLHFPSFVREKPFIFSTPSDAQVIEDFVEQVSVQKKERKEQVA